MSVGLTGLEPVAVSLPLLLRRLLSLSVVHTADWEALAPPTRSLILAAPDDHELLAALLSHELITPYQTSRVRLGENHALVLGNYRLLDKIGEGGMGVVFRAEHIKLREPVALKALFIDGEKNRRAVDRFFHEVRAVTRLKHPNIVAAIDAGEQPGAGPKGSPVPYMVMEYVDGRNLEDLVIADGPMAIELACLVAYQVADALTEAHRCELVHRDVKPGNVIVTPDGSAKLLDFGVARLPSADDRMTKDGARLGTISYMAPEQVRNARLVDTRADLFGLGATLFFMLTGHDPFSPPAGAAGAHRPPRAAEYRAGIPAPLDAMLGRLMALNLLERTQTAEQAMRELLPFVGEMLSTDRRPQATTPKLTTPATPKPAEPIIPPAKILIVDDQTDIRRVCKLALSTDGARCDEVGTGTDALSKLQEVEYDLVLLDVDLPGLNGEHVLKRIRACPPVPHLKVIMLSGRTTGDDLSRLMLAGADDFLTKPFSLVQLRARVKCALKLKDAQTRSETLTQRLMTLNAELERSLGSKDNELLHTRGAMVLALAKIVEQRSAETGSHLIRLQKFCKVLGEAAMLTPGYARRFGPDFLQALVDAAPLHDVGKTAVPDEILNKPGPLNPQERLLMEAHTIIGADTLQEVARRYRFATGFLQMAADIARHHHERWDGSGYPDKLAGEAIPLAARIIAICDVYDALRARRVYKPALSHNIAVMTMCEASIGHFDPGLLIVFRMCADQFDTIYRETTD